MQRHAHALDPACSGPKFVAPDRGDDPIKHDAREKFRGRVLSRKRGNLVQVPEVQFAQDAAQDVGRAADVDDDAVGVEMRSAKFDVNDHGGAVEPLEAVRFLVDAGAREELPRRTFYQRTVRMLDLFERVGERQRSVA